MKAGLSVLYAECAFSFQSEKCSLCYCSLTCPHHLEASVVVRGSFCNVYRQALSCTRFYWQQHRRRQNGFYWFRVGSIKVKSVETDQSITCSRFVHPRLTHIKKETASDPRAGNLACLCFNNYSYLKFETSPFRWQSSRAFE